VPQHALGDDAALNPKIFNAASLAENLKILITSQAVLDRCKIYAEKIYPDPALHETCAIIENFSGDQL
jgi:hypothetical protein